MALQQKYVSPPKIFFDNLSTKSQLIFFWKATKASHKHTNIIYIVI